MTGSRQTLEVDVPVNVDPSRYSARVRSIEASLPSFIITYESAKWLANGCPPSDKGVGLEYFNALEPGRNLAFACTQPLVLRDDRRKRHSTRHFQHSEGYKPVIVNGTTNKVLESQAGRIYVLFANGVMLTHTSPPVVGVDYTKYDRIKINGLVIYYRVRDTNPYKRHKPAAYLLSIEVEPL